MMTCMMVKLIMLIIIIIMMKKGYHHRGDENVSILIEMIATVGHVHYYTVHACTLCLYAALSTSVTLFSLSPSFSLSSSPSLSLSPPFFPARGRLPRQPFEVSEDPPVSPIRSYSKKASQSLSKLIIIIIINRLVMQAQSILF